VSDNTIKAASIAFCLVWLVGMWVAVIELAGVAAAAWGALIVAGAVAVTLGATYLLARMVTRKGPKS
jgi:hypothetical protein